MKLPLIMHQHVICHKPVPHQGLLFSQDRRNQKMSTMEEIGHA